MSRSGFCLRCVPGAMEGNEQRQLSANHAVFQEPRRVEVELPKLREATDLCLQKHPVRISRGFQGQATLHFAMSEFLYGADPINAL